MRENIPDLGGFPPVPGHLPGGGRVPQAPRRARGRARQRGGAGAGAAQHPGPGGAAGLRGGGAVRGCPARPVPRLPHHGRHDQTIRPRPRHHQVKTLHTQK